MKKLKKLLVIPALIGTIGATNACTTKNLDVNSENLNEMITSVNQYLDSISMFSTETAEATLKNYLTNGLVNILTSKDNFTVTFSNFGNDTSSPLIKATICSFNNSKSL